MSEKAWFIVAGLPGAGKSELVSRLASNFGFESLNIGDELARLYRIDQGLEQDAPVNGLARMATHKMIRHTKPDYFADLITGPTAEKLLVDGLRNLYDAKKFIKVGGHVISLIAPRPVRFTRRLSGDRIKDSSMDLLMERELSEMDDSDKDGAQALKVMLLAGEHGFFVDGSKQKSQVFEDVVNGIESLGIDLSSGSGERA